MFNGVDWFVSFYPAAQNVLHPYLIPSFINPPWLALLLWPFVLLPARVGYVMNIVIAAVVFSALVLKRGGSWLGVILTLTSLPFFALAHNGTIEWLPALSFLLPPAWGLTLLLLKPQDGIFAALDWWLKASNKIKFFIPSLIVIALSLSVWRGWPALLLDNYHYVHDTQNMASWNHAPFPWLVPVGLALLFYVVRYTPRDGELFGVLATLCLVPYFAFHSLIIVTALLNSRDYRIGVLTWAAGWLWLVMR